MSLVEKVRLQDFSDLIAEFQRGEATIEEILEEAALLTLELVETETTPDK